MRLIQFYLDEEKKHKTLHIIQLFFNPLLNQYTIRCSTLVILTGNFPKYFSF